MDRVKYEQDYYQWTQAMVKALREREYTSLDWDHLIDEIDDMGKSQKRAIESLLMRQLIPTIPYLISCKL